MLEKDTVLETALENSTKAGLPAINVAPNQGKFLQLLARLKGTVSLAKFSIRKYIKHFIQERKEFSRLVLSEDTALYGWHAHCLQPAN